MSAGREEDALASPAKAGFGTFGGVFTPSILTILGVIMFLRAGFVTGQAGVGGTLAILLIAECIALITALSMSVIATNTPVKGGGAYYLISRALGSEFGGSIGLALYLAQALSVPFYLIGFTEALVLSFPVLRAFTLWIAVGTALVLFIINLVGTGWAIKSQYAVMTVLGLAVASFLTGAVLRFSPELLRANWSPSYTEPRFTFWVMFAIYFPAVTGIMAGINMSGDLKNPSRSLVRGTLAAVGVGFAVYLAQLLLCGGSQVRADLAGRPYETLLNHAFLWRGLVMGGVFAATLSSAMGSMLGAPRVLQALARDRIFRSLRPFAFGTKGANEPRPALWLTLLITLLVIALAESSGNDQAFNMVASVVAMFFLCTYGMVNLAAFVESFGANPSFRPDFRYSHWTISLIGAVACLGVMLLIDVVAALVAVALISALYATIARRLQRSMFGDARRGFLYSMVTRHLLRLRDMRLDPKNWRPTFLVLAGNPRDRRTLIQYAVWLEAGHGIVTVANVLAGDLGELAGRRRTALDSLNRFIREEELQAFAEVMVADSLDAGIGALCQATSIGPIKPNTLLLGWPGEQDRYEAFAHHLRTVRLLEMSLIGVIDRGVPPDDSAARRIDVWWRGRENGSLMLILAHLLTRNWEWRRASIRIIRCVEEEAGRAPAREALAALAKTGRIEAEIQILVAATGAASALRRVSQDADVVLVGFQPPAEGETAAFFARYEAMLGGLPTVLLVSSSGAADLLA